MTQENPTTEATSNAVISDETRLLVSAGVFITGVVLLNIATRIPDLFAVLALGLGAFGTSITFAQKQTTTFTRYYTIRLGVFGLATTGIGALLVGFYGFPVTVMATSLVILAVGIQIPFVLFRARGDEQSVTA